VAEGWEDKRDAVVVSVSLYLGLPGDGKSMSGVRKVVAVLSGGRRTVVTNLPLEVGELESYLRAEYGRDFDCRSRVVLLAQEQVRKFWLVRSDTWRLVDLEDDAWAKNQFPSLQRVFRYVRGGPESVRPALETLTMRAVIGLKASGEVEEGDLGKLALEAVYVIDEAQNFWPARSFQTTPKGLLFYLSQHRHVGDDCIFITQKESQLEKVVRNLVMEFWVFRNLGQRKRMGFRLPSVFGYACYDNPPSAVGSHYSSVGSFRMDTAGLAKCYRTADGVGMGGPTMEADATRKRRDGFSWKWAVVILLATVYGALQLPGLLAMWGMKVLGGVGPVVGVTNAATAPAVVVTAAPTNAVVSVVVTQVVREVVTPARSVDSIRWTNSPSIVGAMQTELGWFVSLSDGRILGPEDYTRARLTSAGCSGIQVRPGEAWLSWSEGTRRKPAL